MDRKSLVKYIRLTFSFVLALTLLALAASGSQPVQVYAQDEPPRGGSVEELGHMPQVKTEEVSSKQSTGAPLPAVDEVACTEAWNISVNETDEWGTNMTGATDLIDSYPIISWDESGPEYIYRFSTSAASMIMVYLSNMTVDLDIFVLDGGPSGACNSLNAIRAGDTYAAFPALSNHYYYLVVDGYFGVSGPFTISVYSNDNVYSSYNLPSKVPNALDMYTTGATHEGADPSFASCGQTTGNASVWFYIVAPRDGEVSIDTFGSNYDTMLGVWRHESGGNTLMGCSNDAAGKKQSQVSFPVLAGQEFYFGVAQKGAETGGNLSLHLTSFADVTATHPLWRYVEGFFRQGITTGCATNPMRYCPAQQVTRAQMAVFIMRAKYGSGFVPANIEPDLFVDVPVVGMEWMEPWIEQFYQTSITTGCGGSIPGVDLRYCPSRGVTRGEMAVFLLRAISVTPVDFEPDIFVDVPTPGKEWMEPWIESLYMKGITTGCSGSTPGVDLRYCPEQIVTRAEMATFIDRAFSFPPLP